MDQMMVTEFIGSQCYLVRSDVREPEKDDGKQFFKSQPFFNVGLRWIICPIVAFEQGIFQILSRQYSVFRGLPCSTQDFTVSGIPTLL
jgi:hypothetical protein